jgi:hypothetical protein
MEKSPWEANGSSARQEIYHILWNLKYHKHKSLQLSLPPARWFESNSPILFQFYTPIYANVLWLVSFLQISPLKLCMYVTCAHVIILDLITPVICGKVYKSRSSSLCSFLQSPVILSLLWMNISPTPYSWRPQPLFFP